MTILGGHWVCGDSHFNTTSLDNLTLNSFSGTYLTGSLTPNFKSGTGTLSGIYLQGYSHRSLEYQRPSKVWHQSLLAFSPNTTVYRDQRSEKQLAKVPRRVKVSLRLVLKNLNVNCTRTSGDTGCTQWVRSIMSDPCDPWHYDGWKLNKVWWIYPAASQLYIILKVM